MKLSLRAGGVIRSGPERTLIDDYLKRANGLARATGFTNIEEQQVDLRRAKSRSEETKLLMQGLPQNSKVVIFDEPTSGLDVITANSIIELIKRCKDEGKTVIFSSHIMSEVDLLCDDLAIIDKGDLVYSDTMTNFRQQYAGTSLTEAFINIVKNNHPQTV